MHAALEFTHGVIRVYDADPASGEPVEGFFAVVNVAKIGPGEALLSADVSNRRLTRADIVGIKQCLIDHGFTRAYAWRRNGRRVPYGGHIIRTAGPLNLWAVDLLPRIKPV